MRDWTPVEHLLYIAVGLIEDMGADVLLTEAVTHVGDARRAIEQFVVATPNPTATTETTDEPSA